MRYLIIGAGGTGGCIAAVMAEAGKDVEVIARGKHLKKIKEQGLWLDTPDHGNYQVKGIKAYTMDEYIDMGNSSPDVIFVCVKAYSLPEVIEFINKCARAKTIVIPVLNIYGTGKRMQLKLPRMLVTDGCIYISANITEPGHIKRYGEIFRIVFGVRQPEEYVPGLKKVAADLQDSGIDAVLSRHIQRDTLQKFSYVSAQAGCGLYYGIRAGDMQQPGEFRDSFVELVREINALANVMNLTFLCDIIHNNLNILDDLEPTASTSLQRDLMKGTQSEIDGLIYEVVRMGETYGVPVPAYEKIWYKFKDTYQ